jgi:signal transduction histidine kinase
MKRFGLRARVTAGFAAAAFVVATAMGILSYQLTRDTLVTNRERNAVRAAYADAAVVNQALVTTGPRQVLESLNTGSTRRALIYRDGHWYSRNANTSGSTSIPPSLLNLVTSGKTGRQRVITDNGSAVVVGIPLADGTGFYVIDSLHELDRTLTVLALVLVLVAAGTTAAGAGIGWYATRRVLRPLTVVVRAAQEIAAGDVTARLDPAVEPELAALTTSFNHMVDELADRIDRDRRFAADVSHELRSPLQTLSAAASVLSRRSAHLDPRSAAAARLVADEVERFQRLVTDLLELSRADLEVDRAPVDLEHLARAACANHNEDPDVVVVEPGTDPVWAVDRRRMEQVFSNLLDNARRYGGGVVAVRIGENSGTRFIEVDDEGPGVRPEDRDVVFGRFVRGRSASARADGDGTGLGLALVAQHVAAHGARIFVTDRPGGGARFRIEFGELASRATQHSGELASRATQHSGELAGRATQHSGELASRATQDGGELASRATPDEMAGRATQHVGEAYEPSTGQGAEVSG